MEATEDSTEPMSVNSDSDTSDSENDEEEQVRAP